jgi:hypothetical protein
MKSYQEKEVVNELLLNLYGFQSKLFQKVDETNDRLLKEMSQISYRFLHFKERSLSIDFHDAILPKVFYVTLEVPLIQLPTIQSSTLLKKILDYFYHLASKLYILRAWCRFSSAEIELSQIENEEIIIVKTSINNNILAIEQELSVIELQLRDCPSLMEKEIPYYKFSREQHNVTLLKFYQHCSKYENLINSLLGIMINFHDDYDLFSPNSSKSSMKSQPSTATPKKDDPRNILQQSFNHVSFLFQTEKILRKSEKLEHYQNMHRTEDHSTGAGEESRSDKKHGLIFKTERFSSKIHNFVIPSSQFFYLFMKQLIIQFSQSLTQQIMKSIWLTTNRTSLKTSNTTTVQMNNPSERSLLSVLFNNQLNGISLYGKHNRLLSFIYFILKLYLPLSF